MTRELWSGLCSQSKGTWFEKLYIFSCEWKDLWYKCLENVSCSLCCHKYNVCVVFGDPAKGKNKLQCEVKGNSWSNVQSSLARIQFSKVQLPSKCYPFKLFSLSTEGKLDSHFVIHMHSHLLYIKIS